MTIPVIRPPLLSQDKQYRGLDNWTGVGGVYHSMSLQGSYKGIVVLTSLVPVTPKPEAHRFKSSPAQARLPLPPGVELPTAWQRQSFLPPLGPGVRAFVGVWILNPKP